jgi:hypothetical protein
LNCRMEKSLCRIVIPISPTKIIPSKRKSDK